MPEIIATVAACGVICIGLASIIEKLDPRPTYQDRECNWSDHPWYYQHWENVLRYKPEHTGE